MIVRMKRRLLGAIRFVIFVGLFIVLVAPEWPAFADDFYRIDAVVGLRRFDFLLWETRAALQKAQAMLANNQAYLDDADRKQIVLDFLARVDEIDHLNADIDALYLNPDSVDPTVAAQTLQVELTQKRAALETIQPLAEAIVQDQVAWALRQEGFSLLGVTWPPVLMHMTPLPSLLVVSPRNRIESLYQVPLQHGLTTPVEEEMETAVFTNLNLSALVVPIGGMGTYPAMIMETGSVSWLSEVTAHEWTHHWLTLQPLGIRYGQDPQMRIINETVASMVDVEIRDKVLQRFYPEYMPSPTPVSTVAPAPDTPLPFDFRAEMAQTRMRVDELLAAGEITTAEAYMEDRRALFVANGYAIRKLNQAYFAFHGAYAAQPGATGGDPIGPMLRAIRDNSPSLHAFLETIGGITQYDDLVTIYESVPHEQDMPG